MVPAAKAPRGCLYPGWGWKYGGLGREGKQLRVARFKGCVTVSYEELSELRTLMFCVINALSDVIWEVL